MIKVIHYLRHLTLGGTEKTCQLFVGGLDPQRFEVHVAYENDGLRGDLFRQIPNVTMHHITRQGLPTDLETIRSVVDSVGADILHVYRSGYEEFPEPNVDVRVPHFVETNVFGQLDHNPAVDASLFMSEWLLKDTKKRLAPISRGFVRKIMDFVNNPIEDPYTNDTLKIADQWHREGAIILGRCGRPDPGIYHAINVKAAHLLRMQGYDVRFLVVAPPPNMVHDLQEWDIPFYGIEPTVDPVELSKFYNSVDIYAHARADGETFGVNIAEAMMHSKPVVTHVAEPSVPGMGVFQSQTTLVDHGETGFVSPNDVGAYMEALLKLITNRTRMLLMGQEGYKKALREYHVDVCVNKLERIYEALCRT